jgi:hypothetical protein
MTIQRSTLAFVQAASDIDPAPCTGREPENPGRRLTLISVVSVLLFPFPSTHFILIQHQDEVRCAWS